MTAIQRSLSVPLLSSQGGERGSERNEYIPLYVYKYIIQDETPISSRCNQVARKIIRGMFFVLSAAGTVPYATISLQLAGKNLGGYLLVGGNAISFAALNAWAWFSFIDFVSPEAFYESEINNSKRNCIRDMIKTSTHVSAIAFGMLSQLPLGYLAYAYNGNSYTYAALTIAADSSFPILSLALSFQRIYKNFGYSSLEIKLNSIRIFILNRIKENTNFVLNGTKEQQEIFFKSLEEIKDSQNSSSIEMTSCYLQLVLSSRPLPEKAAEGIKDKVVKGIGRIVGVALVTARLGFLGVIANKATTKLFSERSFLNIGSLTAIVGANAYLSFKVVLTAIETLYDKLVRRSREQNLSSLIYPKMKKKVELLALGLGSLSWGPSFKASHDAIEDKTLQILTEFSVCISTAILVINAMIDLSHVLIEYRISQKGENITENATLQITSKHKKLSTFIEHMSCESMAGFLLSLPEVLIDEFLKEGKIDRNQLISYLDASQINKRSNV